jgi:mono/diheme cytochrome c family protein
MRKWAKCPTVLCGMFLLAGAAVAMEPTAEERAGLGIAQRMCGECHAVSKGESTSPHPQAPSFLSVALARGQTETSLRVWMQSPHRSMPDFNLGEADSHALVAYILSLREPTGR